jgi:serine/threonine protein phosphatase PrpC
MRCTGKTLSGLACEVEDIQPGDNFCYICGSPVTKELRVPPRAVPAIVEPPFKGCLECGIKRVNKDGYCMGCGTYCKPPLRENFLIELSASEAVRSNLGMQHKRNDDYGLVATRLVGGQEIRWEIVCDGLSQSQNPHLASEAACKAASTVIEMMVIDGHFDPEAVIMGAFNAAQNAVLLVPEDPEKPVNDSGKPFKRAMTTIVIALLLGNNAYLGWAGDSRIYAIYQRDGRCGARRLTRDDTKLEKLRLAGMTFKDSSKEPRATEMSQCLGPIGEGDSLVPNYAVLSLQHVAAIVGCTDGAYSYFDPGPNPETDKDQPQVELAQAFAGCGGNALAFADKLVTIANDRGGQDNITVAALFCNPISQGGSNG